MYLRQKSQKGQSQSKTGQLRSVHTFSFFSYFDEDHSGYGALRAVNLDVYSGGAVNTVQKLSARSMLIFVEEGDLCLTVDQGTEKRYEAGDAVLLSATKIGMSYRIQNANQHSLLKLYTFYFDVPAKTQNSVGHIAVPPHEGLKSILFPGLNKTAYLQLPQSDVRMFLLHANLGEDVRYPLKKGRKLWVEVIRGSVELEQSFWEEDLVQLNAGDALGLDAQSPKLQFEALEGVELFIVDMPDD